MKLSGDGKLLRIFIGEADQWHGKPLYEEIVALAQDQAMAGATVIKGFMGFGCKSHMHKARKTGKSVGLPIIIELVDNVEQINKFIPLLDKMVPEGLITLESANVIMYRAQ